MRHVLEGLVPGLAVVGAEQAAVLVAEAGLGPCVVTVLIALYHVIADIDRDVAAECSTLWQLHAVPVRVSPARHPAVQYQAWQLREARRHVKKYTTSAGSALGDRSKRKRANPALSK